MCELKEVLYSEIEGFREKGHQFINGELNLMQFKHISGGFGVYAHRGGKEFMIRLRIPSGILKIDDLKFIYEAAKKYGLQRIHLTTRQAIQLHGLSIDEICDLMEELLEHDIYTRGAGGDYPRNVAISPLSGVNPEEAFDVTPYAVEAGNYFLKQIYKYHLPRKLKVSFSSSNCDEAHCTVQDLGFLAVKHDGKEYFQVYLGGGLGQNPKLALKYPSLIEPKDVLYHLEAMTRLFKAEGDYDNRNRARIRYIVERLGEETFLAEYQKYLDEVKAEGGLEFEVEHNQIQKTGEVQEFNSSRVINQKQMGLYSVYLHPIGGQLELNDLKKIIEELEKIEEVQIRLAMEEGVYFRNLNALEAEQVLQLTEPMSGNTDLEYSVSCIGAPICQIGQCNSQALLRKVLDYFKVKNYTNNVLPSIHFSGCINSCGVHQIGAIGFTGKKKKVDNALQECFTLSVGGGYEVGKTRLGDICGEVLTTKIPELLYELAQEVEQSNLELETYLETKPNQFKALVTKYLV